MIEKNIKIIAITIMNALNALKPSKENTWMIIEIVPALNERRLDTRHETAP